MNDVEVACLNQEIRAVINSKRRESLIKNNEDLQKILKKRNYSSTAKKEEQHNLNKPQNIYGSSKIVQKRRDDTDFLRCFFEPPKYPRVRGEIETYEIAREVCDLICDEIGSDWKDMFRRLIKDPEIECVEMENKLLKDIIRKCLIIFQKKVPKEKWLPMLNSALQGARRLDLNKQIKNMGYGISKEIYTPVV